MGANVIYVDETGNLGEGFLGLGIYSPLANMEDSALVDALRCNLRSKSMVDAALAERGYLHAAEDPWDLKVEILHCIGRTCPGVFEFVWIDQEGEREAREAGFTKDMLLNLMLALPCIQMEAAIVEVESRTGLDAMSVQSIKEENLRLLRDALAEMTHPFGPVVARNWRPNSLEVRTKGKSGQGTGLQAVDYLTWFRRRVHGGKRNDPVNLEAVARKMPMPKFPPDWLHYERYTIGPR
jgi:hypothetical protein